MLKASHLQVSSTGQSVSCSSREKKEPVANVVVLIGKKKKKGSALAQESRTRQWKKRASRDYIYIYSTKLTRKESVDSHFSLSCGFAY